MQVNFISDNTIFYKLLEIKTIMNLQTFLVELFGTLTIMFIKSGGKSWKIKTIFE